LSRKCCGVLFDRFKQKASKTNERLDSERSKIGSESVKERWSVEGREGEVEKEREDRKQGEL
jgi:hypothetical protein